MAANVVTLDTIRQYFDHQGRANAGSNRQSCFRTEADGGFIARSVA
ncbi:hypothetical protein [Mycolicibacterium litorale]|nr:hypothetical protein [Mycolicibacterium litorale]